MSQHERTCAGADQRVHAVLREALATLHFTQWNLFRNPAIACDESGGNSSEWHNPFKIFLLEVGWSRPKLLLITHQMLHKGRHQTVIRIFAGPQFALRAVIDMLGIVTRG